MSLYPNALVDGKFLVKFFVCRPGDAYYSALNLGYWLEYHPKSPFVRPEHESMAHLICPTSNSEDYAIAEGLVPFRRWVRLTNADTYISGPFDFATLNDHNTRDCIPNDHWIILHKHSLSFSNKVLSLELPDYSAHFSQLHQIHPDNSVSICYNAYFAEPNHGSRL